MIKQGHAAVNADVFFQAKANQHTILHLAQLLMELTAEAGAHACKEILQLVV